MSPLSLSADARRLDSEPLSDQVYRVLRDAISDGTLGAYTHLVQNQLADELQVSRTPVRDALLRLSQEGVVRAVSARGFVVEALSPRDVLDIYEVRIALEVDAVVDSIPSFSPDRLAQLESINMQMGESDDKNLVFELNHLFHTGLVEFSPNRLVERILCELWDRPVSRRLFQRQVADDFDPAAMARAHKPILAALRSQDELALRQELLAHLVESRDAVSLWIADAEDAAEAAG